MQCYVPRWPNMTLKHSDLVKAVGVVKDATKTLGKAMTQVTEVFESLRDDDISISAQSHAQVGSIVSMDGSGVYAFAAQATSLEDLVLLDSCSSHHVFCNPRFVFNICIYIASHL